MNRATASLDARLLCALLALALATAWARKPGANPEIAQLIAVLAESDCRFDRNGTWYDGKRTAAHLQRKYDYVAARRPRTTAEDFIALAGSGSSLSGKPYLVQCPGQPPVRSARWLRQQLDRLRATGDVSPTPP